LVATLISGVGIVSLLFGGIQWWYANQYLPGAIGAALSIKTEMKEQVRPANAVLPSEPTDPHMHARVFQARLTIKNSSKTTVQVVASNYHVMRLPLTPVSPPLGGSNAEIRSYSACMFEQLAPVRQVECPQEGVALLYDMVRSGDDPGYEWTENDWGVSRYTQFWDPTSLGSEVMALGQVVGDGTVFEPNQEYVRSFLFYVPNNMAYWDDELLLEVELVTAKGERLILVEETHGTEQVNAAIESEAEQEDYRQVDYYRRSYPHRYEATEWGTGSLGLISRLTRGEQSVNVIRVLSERREDKVYESPYLVVCIGPSDRLQDAGKEDRIRRDPTVICPGTWYPDASEYYRSMSDFYGLVGLQSLELVSLRPGSEVPAGAFEGVSPTTVFALPPDVAVVNACAPVLETASQTMTHANNVQNALLEHARVMEALESGGLTGNEALTQGLPSLVTGARESGALQERREDYERIKGECAGSPTDVQQPRNRPCLESVPLLDAALDHATEIANALAEHTQVMFDLRDGRISLDDAMERGRGSLNYGVSESGLLDNARTSYEEMTTNCRLS
jgi:hypothetical protein